MKGFFGIGRSVKDKLSAQRFDYTVTIHNLQPWPAGNRAVAIGWQRGKKKRGATRSVYATTALGKTGNLVRFNEKFDLTATLYKASTGSANASQLGPFKKKCLILAVLETDGRTQATAALGRVVVDLAEFAAVDRQETRAFMVSCNKQIHNAVGDPQLLITIRTRWRKSSATVGADGQPMDEGGSMSTDTTGSRMTANLSSFLRFKYSGKGPANVNEEQDLQGFDAHHGAHAGSHSSASRSVGPAVSMGSTKDLDKHYMGTIQESHDESPESPPNARLPAPAPRSTQDSAMQSGSSPVPGSLRAQHAAQAAAQAPVAVVTRGMGAMGLNGSHAPGSYTASVVSPRSTLDDVPAATPASTPPLPARAPAASSTPALASAGSLSYDGMQQELLAAAAAEVSVHLARTAAASSKRPVRAAHAAARRLARTLVCMGPQAPVFGGHMLKLVGAQLDACGGELRALAFWWANLAHLRGLLLSGAPALSELLIPQVLKLERVAFDAVVVCLWEDVLLPTVLGEAGAGGTKQPAAAAAAKASAASKRAQQEAAIKRWFEGLDAVNRRLARLGGSRVATDAAASPHLALLRAQALGQCLKRLDALLFYHLLVPASETAQDILLDYDPASSLWAMPGPVVSASGDPRSASGTLLSSSAPSARPMPVLEEGSLPFVRGLLTFGSGMSVKMTVTRLQQWATGEGGLADGAGTAASGLTSQPLFPLLRAAADLLMMPKELLLEAAIRRDVCQALSMRSMLHILSRFAADEYAGDGVAPGILDSLREEALRAGSGRPPLSDLSVGYRPPGEELILGNVSSGSEPGMEYDADSEDELTVLAASVGLPGACGRFRLLHDLWTGGAPRSVVGAGSVAGGRSQSSAASYTHQGMVPLPAMSY